MKDNDRDNGLDHGSPTPTPIEQDIIEMLYILSPSISLPEFRKEILSLIESHTNAAIEKYQEELDKPMDLKHPYQSIRKARKLEKKTL